MIGLRLPADCTGLSVLDVGCYDGGQAYLCAQRGAAPVTAIDAREYRLYKDWPDPPWDLPGVRFVEADLFDWDEPADLVICSNVIYHVKDWRAGLARLRALTRGTLYLRTSFVLDGADDGWKRYDDGMGHPNGTVWCRPTPDGLVRALRAAGFDRVEEQGRAGDHIVVECS